MKSIVSLFRPLIPVLAALWPWLAPAQTATFSYDDAGRLIGVYFAGGTSITYLYDGAGNLLREVRTSFSDSDGDGMDDGWELVNFGNLNRNGSGDADGDGQTDLAEFMAGTNPNDNQSALKLTQASSSTGVSFTLQWASVAGKTYRVQYNDTLQPSGWRTLGGDVTATGTVTSKVDATVSGQTRRYYRVIALF